MNSYDNLYSTCHRSRFKNSSRGLKNRKRHFFSFFLFSKMIQKIVIQLVSKSCEIPIISSEVIRDFQKIFSEF